MKNKVIVPKFKNEKEEAKFWAKLDLSEYFEPEDFKRGVVFKRNKMRKGEYITLDEFERDLQKRIHLHKISDGQVKKSTKKR